MNDQAWRDNDADETAIARIEAGPTPDEQGNISKQELSRFKRFWLYLFPKLKRSGELADAYAQAEIDSKNAQTEKTLAEASEIAARRELIETQTRVEKQKENAQFITNLESIEGLDEELSRQLAFAKLLADNPEVRSQLEKVKEMVVDLGLKHGTTIAELDEPKKITGQALEASRTVEGK